MAGQGAGHLDDIDVALTRSTTNELHCPGGRGITWSKRAHMKWRRLTIADKDFRAGASAAAELAGSIGGNAEGNIIQDAVEKEGKGGGEYDYRRWIRHK